MTYTVCDFFCGAGGFSQGFKEEGFEVIFSLDNWNIAVETHNLNHEHKSICMNILDIKSIVDIDNIIPDTDIIIGSPPCVSFSSSNKSGNSDKTLGLKLIKQFLRIISHKKNKPNSKLKYFIMENVPNSLKYIKDYYTPEELNLPSNYNNLIINNKCILIASDYGSPQYRKRAICGNFIIPIKLKNKIYIEDILKYLGNPLDNNKNKIIDPYNNSIVIEKKNLTDHFYDTELPDFWVEKAKKLKIDHGYMGKMDFPDRTNRLCRTIMATESYSSRESIIFQKENTDKFRAPTIRELSTLMGYPITYQFYGNSTTIKHKQIGNSVCVHLSKALAKEIKIKSNINNNFTYQNNIDLSKIFNLNNVTEPIYLKIKQTYKKNNAKFKNHVPFLKIKQCRVELDNCDSDFFTDKIKWKVNINKGAGKNFQILNYNLDNNTFLDNLIFNKFKNSLYSSKKFQEMFCTNCYDGNHLHPNILLNNISNIINEININHVNFNRDNITDIDIKILIAYYLLKKCIELLN